MKRAAIILVVLIVLALAGFSLHLLANKDVRRENFSSSADLFERVAEKTSDEKTIFTAKIFDPALVSHITPLGELNGGYEESQTINGVMINLKTDANRNASEIPVYAPTDMTLEDYSYFTGGEHTPNWHLGFRISKDVKLSFDHITWVPEELKKATPPTPTSAYVPPSQKISYKAGELIAKTSGTDQAHNWNIYLRDNRHQNTFVNQARFEKIKDGYDFVNAVCPFNYYADSVKQEFLSLMGATKAGQAKTCGTNSRDVRGSLSGIWQLTQEGVGADYQGAYATPFSIYKDSADQIVVFEINRQRFILDQTNPTYKDPAAVTGAHCYALTEYGGQPAKGYAYFQIVSDMEMQLQYAPSGTCPSQFPAEGSVTYYR
ncbi:MAG: hypothetical protein WC238_05270 [Parcubacteria group bacterium]|jgi:hypothetical protein